MKTKILLLSALAVAAMTSCSKEVDQTKSDPVEITPGLLEIRLAGSETIDNRAAGAPVEVTETKVVKGMVFVFKGTGADPALDAKATFDFTATGPIPVRVNITQGIRQVYVVANMNPLDFASINNLSDLQHMTNKLTLNAFRTNPSLAMSGMVNNVDATTATTIAPLAVTVPLFFVGSRIHVDWDITNLNVGLSGLLIEGAAILNVNSMSEYIPTPNGSNAYQSLTHNLYDYVQGVGSTATFTGSYLPSVGTTEPTTNAFDSELFITPANQGFANNYTYVFENKSQKPIIVAFKGKYKDVTYYWPVIINGALNGIGGVNAGDLSASVRRGVIYKVKAVIKGLGGEDPYAPINPGAIDVTVIPASWLATIQIDQEFQ